MELQEVKLKECLPRLPVSDYNKVVKDNAFKKYLNQDNLFNFDMVFQGCEMIDWDIEKVSLQSLRHHEDPSHNKYFLFMEIPFDDDLTIYIDTSRKLLLDRVFLVYKGELLHFIKSHGITMFIDRMFDYIEDNYSDPLQLKLNKQ